MQSLLKSSFILFFLISSIYAQDISPQAMEMVQMGEYKLPDFKINRDDPTCETVDKLGETAVKDIANLEKVIRSNTEALKVIDEALGLINECCSSIEKLKLIQVSKKTLKQNQVELMNAEMNEIVNKKLKQIESFLQKVSKDDLRTKCKEVQDATKDLINYVKWVNEQIQSQLIDTYLTTRISDLKTFKDKCIELANAKNINIPRTELTLNTLVSGDNFASNPTLVKGTFTKNTEDLSIDYNVIFNLRLNQTDVKFTSCKSAEYGLFDIDLKTPTFAIFQNQYFEASATSFGFSVSDGNQNQIAYTTGSVTESSTRVYTYNKPVYSISKTSSHLIVKFMDGSVSKQVLATTSSTTFTLNLFGAPVIGFKACTESKQLTQLSLITVLANVIIEQASV